MYRISLISINVSNNVISEFVTEIRFSMINWLTNSPAWTHFFHLKYVWSEITKPNLSLKFSLSIRIFIQLTTLIKMLLIFLLTLDFSLPKLLQGLDLPSTKNILYVRTLVHHSWAVSTHEYVLWCIIIFIIRGFI